MRLHIMLQHLSCYLNIRVKALLADRVKEGLGFKGNAVDALLGATLHRQ